MQRRVGALFLVAFVSAPLQLAAAGAMPDIKAGARNVVPECVTPGRLLDYLRNRNPQLDARYDSVPVEYMRLGEQLGIRWDYAFYQMILETGALSYRRGNRSGDVKPTQNNFAGLGATGGGEHGESFRDIPTGVRAHLEHLLLYAGEKLDNPAAERTRKVQEWGVLTSWQARFNRPITYADLAAKWAPGSGGYAKMLDAIAERFGAFCQRPDPRPELVAMARGRTLVAEDKPERPGAELAKRAIEQGKTDDLERRSTLGAQEMAKAPPLPYKILNAPPQPERPAAEAAPAEPVAKPAPPAARADATPKTKPRTTASIAPTAPPTAPKSAAEAKPPFQMASAAGAAKPLVPPTPPAAGQKCRVWTASYGGQKALIIKSMIDRVVNYTVLDVNEGAEKRESEAFISAYAKEGTVAGEFTNQSLALDKAFELCPEG